MDRASSDEYRIMFQLDQEPEDIHPEVAEQSRRSFGAFEEAVAQGVEGGAMAGDPLTVAHLLWSSLHGMLSLHLAGKLTAGRTLDDLLSAPPVHFEGR